MPATGHRRTGMVAALISGLLIGSLFIWHTSSAAFTGSTQNGANGFSAGKVTITSNLAASAMFAVTNLAPGASGSQCIDLTYSGTVPAVVRLSAAYNSSNPQSTLAPYLDFTIQEVDPTAAACTIAGAVGAGYIAAAHTTLKTMVDTLKVTPADLGWTPTGSAAETKRYRFVYTLEDNNAAQTQAATVDFTWTAASR